MIRPNFIWVTGFWIVLSILVRPGWLIFSAGAILCLVLMLIRAPGEFWFCAASLPLGAATSERYLARSVAYKPKIPQPYLKLGLICYGRQQWSAAIPLLQQTATLRGPKCPLDLKFLLAAAYRENRQAQLAIPLLDEVAAGCAASAEVFYNLALCHMQLADLRSALDAARRSHSLDPHAVRPVMIMANLYFRMGEFVNAKKEYEWLVGTLPKPAESLYWLGRSELELGDTQAAAQHLQLALERLIEHAEISTIPLDDVKCWLQTAKGMAGSSRTS